MKKIRFLSALFAILFLSTSCDLLALYNRNTDDASQSSNLKDSLRLISFESQVAPTIRSTRAIASDAVVVDENEDMDVVAIVKNDNRLSFIDLEIYFSALSTSVIYNEGNGEYQCATTTIKQNDLWITKISFNYLPQGVNGFIEIKEANFLSLNQTETKAYLPEDCKKVINYHQHSYGEPTIISNASFYEAGEATKACTDCGHVKHYDIEPLCNAFLTSFNYELISSGTRYAISNYIGSDKNPIVPNKYNELPVSTISANAFKNSSIETLTISNTIESLPEGVFSTCSSLSSIVFDGTAAEWNYLIGSMNGIDFLPIVETVVVQTNNQNIEYHPSQQLLNQEVFETILRDEKFVFCNKEYQGFAPNNVTPYGLQFLNDAGSALQDPWVYVYKNKSIVYNAVTYVFDIEIDTDQYADLIKNVTTDDDYYFIQFKQDIGQFDFNLKIKISLGEFNKVQNYYFRIYPYTQVFEKMSIEDVYRVNESNDDFALIDSSTGGFIPNGSESLPYRFVEIEGQLTYISPDLNFALLSDGKCSIQLFRLDSFFPGGYNLDKPVLLPFFKVGEAVIVRGELYIHEGTILISYISSIEKGDSSRISSPVFSEKLGTDVIGKHYWQNNLQNCLVEMRGKYVANSLKDQRGYSIEINENISWSQRMSFQMISNGKTMTVSYDYHTENSNTSSGVFAMFRAFVLGASDEQDIIVKGFLTFSGKGNYRFTGEDKLITNWAVTIFDPSHIANDPNPPVDPIPVTEINLNMSEGLHALTFDFVNYRSVYASSFPTVGNDTGVDDTHTIGDLPIISNGCFTGTFDNKGYLMMKNKDRQTMAFIANNYDLMAITKVTITIPSSASHNQSYDISFGHSAFEAAQNGGTHLGNTGGTVTASAEDKYGFFAVSTLNSAVNGQIATLTIEYVVSNS